MSAAITGGRKDAAKLVPGHGLVLPDDGPSALARSYTTYLVASCRRFLGCGSRLRSAQRPAHERTAAIVADALQAGDRALLSCFSSPLIGTPLHCLQLREELGAFAGRIDEAAATVVPNLLLEIGLRSLIPRERSVLCDGTISVASPAIGGELLAPAGTTGLRFSASHIAAVSGDRELARLPLDLSALRTALAGDAAGFRLQPRFHRIGKATHLATMDLNPIAAFEAHPEKSGNHIDLGGRSEGEWVAMLEQCLELIGRYLPRALREMELMLKQIIPVGYDTVRHLSASYRESVGTVYLTLHPNVMTMTEAVIHEFQHNKFNVSAYQLEYIRNAFEPLYKSPVRPDPRPLWGILLAVHAFLPVVELYRRMRDEGHPWASEPGFDRRLSELDLKNYEGMQMLRDNAQLTEAGRAMFDELEQLESAHLRDRAARGLAISATDSHLA